MYNIFVSFPLGFIFFYQKLRRLHRMFSDVLRQISRSNLSDVGIDVRLVATSLSWRSTLNAELRLFVANCSLICRNSRPIDWNLWRVFEVIIDRWLESSSMTRHDDDDDDDDKVSLVAWLELFDDVWFAMLIVVLLFRLVIGDLKGSFLLVSVNCLSCWWTEDLQNILPDDRWWLL